MRERDRELDKRPPPADDLQKINGIGPVVAQRLGAADITSYPELAALTADRIAELLAGVRGISAGLIASQDWIGQARRLAGDLSEDPEGRQRYATFHVELLIDPDGEVRRTKVRHYQSDTEESWPGWDQEQLIAVLRGHAAPDISPATMPAPGRPPAPHPAPLPIHLEGPGPAEEGARRSFRLDDQPTSVRMTLRVDRPDAIDADALDVVAEVAARAVGSRNRHHLGTIKGTIAFDHPSSLELTSPPLPAGLYSLEAAVTLYQPGYQPGDKPLSRHHGRGELLYVARTATATAVPGPSGRPGGSRSR